MFQGDAEFLTADMADMDAAYSLYERPGQAQVGVTLLCAGVFLNLWWALFAGGTLGGRFAALRLDLADSPLELRSAVALYAAPLV